MLKRHILGLILTNLVKLMPMLTRRNCRYCANVDSYSMTSDVHDGYFPNLRRHYRTALWRCDRSHGVAPFWKHRLYRNGIGENQVVDGFTYIRIRIWQLCPKQYGLSMLDFFCKQFVHNRNDDASEGSADTADSYFVTRSTSHLTRTDQ